MSVRMHTGLRDSLHEWNVRRRLMFALAIAQRLMAKAPNSALLSDAFGSLRMRRGKARTLELL